MFVFKRTNDLLISEIKCLNKTVLRGRGPYRLMKGIEDTGVSAFR